ncbi:MAG: response regulator, partial [Chitinophagaceae bacterium]
NNISQEVTNPRGLIKQPFNELQKLVLPYNKNYLSIEFAAMQFNEPMKVQYRYMLKGADNAWHESGTNNIATYTQLRPGKYTLRMNATGLNGVWSNEVRELPIIIRPPFWANWWAYGFYLLVAALLVKLYLQYHKRRLKEQQQRAFEQKEAERLKELDAIKDRFFSNITHEFRTPLTLILTPLEKLQQDRSLPEKTTGVINTISRNAKQLLQLVNEFLDFSKLNTGQLKLTLSHGELSPFVASLVQRFAQAAEEKELQLIFSSEGVDGVYLFDEDKWEKIVFNLLSNAIKFTNAGGTINVVLLKRENDWVQLKVMDSGIGITSAELERVFDRFYQVDASDTRHYSGTGIGLALVKELVELMGGRVRAESEPGRGSAFIAELPVTALGSDHEVQPAISAAATIQLISGELTDPINEKPLILVAEDNRELRDFLSTGFDGWNVITAADGLQAWEMILTEMPDVVISDVMMPGRDGLELCQLCKKDPRTGHIGFMMLTSRAAREAKLQGLETGADDYIVKPFHLDELQLRISNLLQLQQKQRKFLQQEALPEKPVQTLPDIRNIFIQQLYKLLYDHLDDPQLNVDFLAKNVSMSRSSLNRKLKNLLDISANDLIRRYRLQQATSLLAAGQDITATAYKVGFNTPSYFSQCFKEQYGFTPSEYISSLGKK